MDRAVYRPTLLDLFCGEGGCSAGYVAAGFNVTGVDLNPMPRYPYRFVQADALEYLAAHGGEYDVIHASPPCQDHSTIGKQAGAHGTGHLLADVRDLLKQTGKPYVIENVPGADMPEAFILCGAAFDLKIPTRDGKTRTLKRHRQFESNVFMLSPGCCCRGLPIVGVYGNGGGQWESKRPDNGGGRSYMAVVQEARDVMGMPWASRQGVSQAIPPAYTKFIGEQLMAHL